MEERGREPELVADVLDEQVAHLPELREHERPLALVEQLGDELVEPGELAGPAGEARPVLQRMRRVVADLLQTHQRGEHEAAAAHAARQFGVGEELVDDLLVHRGLFAGELGVGDLFDLVGQVGQQASVGLRAAEDERLREAAEPGGRVGIVVAFDRGAEPRRGTAAARRAGRD